MEIEITDHKLRRTLEDDSRRIKSYGRDMAKKIAVRLAALKAAEALVDFWPPFSLPERCHELKGKDAGLFSMDLKHPYRLLFLPHDPEYRSTDERERWGQIIRITIVDIKDTHG